MDIRPSLFVYGKARHRLILSKAKECTGMSLMSEVGILAYTGTLVGRRQFSGNQGRFVTSLSLLTTEHDAQPTNRVVDLIVRTH